jgi:hypothetical protein
LLFIRIGNPDVDGLLARSHDRPVDLSLLDDGVVVIDVGHADEDTLAHQLVPALRHIEVSLVRAAAAQGTFPNAGAATGPLLCQAMFESPNGVVITTRRVMEQGWPILLVTHDDDEPRGWQFLNGHGDTDDPTGGITVHPEHVIDRDPTVVELADLPPGWRAWRTTESAEWIREPEPTEESPSGDIP